MNQIQNIIDINKEKARLSSERYRIKNREKVNAYAREYGRKNRSKLNILQQKRRVRNRIQDRLKARDRYYRRKYNITLEQKKIMFSGNVKCAICERDDVLLVIDHDHKTNEIRGILCDRCNMVLGHIKDNISILRSMIKYLGVADD